MKRVLIFDAKPDRALGMQNAFYEMSIDFYRLYKGKIRNRDESWVNDGIEFDLILAHITDWKKDKYKDLIERIKYRLLVCYGGGEYEGRRSKIGDDKVLLISRSIIDTDFLTQQEAFELIELCDNVSNNKQMQLPIFLLTPGSNLMPLNRLLESFYSSLYNGETEEAVKIKSEIKQYITTNKLIG